MYRRKLILASTALVAGSTAGCLGLNSQSGNTPVDDIDVDVEFTIEGGDLVARHLSGGVLPAGRTVYMTVEGEKVAETTLAQDVYAGGEIIRVPDAEDEYHSEERVGLYLNQNNQPVELDTADVEFEHPASSIGLVEWDYDAERDRVVIETGGKGTGELVLKSDDITADDVTWKIPGEVNGTSIVLDGTGFSAPLAVVTNVDSGDEIKLVWQTTEGTDRLTISSFEAP